MTLRILEMVDHSIAKGRVAAFARASWEEVLPFTDFEKRRSEAVARIEALNLGDRKVFEAIVDNMWPLIEGVDILARRAEESSGSIDFFIDPRKEDEHMVVRLDLMFRDAAKAETGRVSRMTVAEDGAVHVKMDRDISGQLYLRSPQSIPVRNDAFITQLISQISFLAAQQRLVA